MSNLRIVTVLAMLIVVTGGAFLLAPEKPPAAGDASCHNPFRDGAKAVSPRFNADVAVGMDQWDAVADLLSRFAREQGWDLRDRSHEVANVVRTLSLSLCMEPSLRIVVLERRWAAQNYAPPIPGKGVSVRVYAQASESDWRTVAREVVSALESQWPQQVRVVDGDGRFIERPAYLSGG